MIGSYIFHIQSPEQIASSRAYAFYSCLLSLLPADYAEELHTQGETPISQCVYGEKSESFWRINLLDQPANDIVTEVLDGLKVLPLHTGELMLELQDRRKLSAEELMQTARSIETERFFRLSFLSPTAFKQAGRYTILPEKELILQSLVNKWNTIFPEYPIEDEDAARMLSNGIRISDYRLRTTRFLMKDSKIPGFVGDLSIEAQLSAPIMELWKMLIAVSEYSGIGIKTALGMGGVKLG